MAQRKITGAVKIIYTAGSGLIRLLDETRRRISDSSTQYKY